MRYFFRWEKHVYDIDKAKSWIVNAYYCFIFLIDLRYVPKKLVVQLKNAIRPLKTAFQAQTRAYLKRLGPELLIPGVRRGACNSEVRSIRAIELQTRENSQPRS